LGGAAKVKRITARAGSWGPFRSDIPVLWDWGAHEIAMTLDVMGEFPMSAAASIQETAQDFLGAAKELLLKVKG